MIGPTFKGSPAEVDGRSEKEKKSTGKSINNIYTLIQNIPIYRERFIYSERGREEVSHAKQASVSWDETKNKKYITEGS